MPGRWRAVLGGLLLAGALPATAGAQVFLASRPQPDFTIGPLFVVASVQPDLGPVTITLSWSLTPAPGRSALDIKQDLILLWPGEVVEGEATGPAETRLALELEQRGFDSLTSGRLPLARRDRMQLGTGTPAVPLSESASFVTFVRRTPTAAQVGPATYVKIPWTSTMADPLAVTVLTLRVRGLVTPRPATWFEELFWGRRWVLTTGFGDIGTPVMALFPLYFEHRDRVVRVGREFALAVANFADAQQLRIENIGPASATRRPSRLRAGAEVISMPLQATEGVAPQMLTVQFSYFSGMIAWRPIVVSVILLALGNLAGFILLSRDVGQYLRGRLQIRRRGEPEFARPGGGGALPRSVAEAIVPGSTTEAEVLRLCGRPDEEGHRRGPEPRRMLVYRGVRRLPRPRLALGPVTTVRHWDEEQHELEVELDGDRVSAVQSRLRRTRAT
jgi:hypothetical protein